MDGRLSRFSTIKGRRSNGVVKQALMPSNAKVPFHDLTKIHMKTPIFILFIHKRFIARFIFLLLPGLLMACAASRLPSHQLFSQAESCCKELSGAPEQRKYRSYWLRCIEMYEAAYKSDPEGPRAAQALFEMGRLYEGLYHLSYKQKDLESAETYLKQAVKRLPGGDCRQKALAILKTMPRSEAGIKREAVAKKRYIKAEADYRKFQANPKKQKSRGNWEDHIEDFEDAYAADPDGPWAGVSLFMVGEVYSDLNRYSGNAEDQRQAEAIYEKILREHPDSAYARKAADRLGLGLQNAKTEAPPIVETPKEAATPGCMANITGIRYWSNPEYTRVVIDADRPAAIESNLLKKDPALDRDRQRLYVDIKNSRLGNIETTIPINDSLLKAARAAQYSQDTVRVVIDIHSFEGYNVFSLPNPFRVVIDVRGKKSSAGVLSPSAPALETGDGASLARQLALGVRRIIIDAGHGGKDPGASGYVRGVHEKTLVLTIAKKLRKKIERSLGCEVIMTRSTDTYLTLEERTGVANMKKGDLFISIHANSARNRNAFGIETYFLNLTTDEESIRVAARENATSERNISELQTILNDLMQNAKINESSRLATYVQKSLCAHLSKDYRNIKNKGVKQAPFYVLIGAQMPAILVETSFISNEMECRRLMDPKYQEALCDGIVAGIRKYIQETKPSAFLEENPSPGRKG